MSEEEFLGRYANLCQNIVPSQISIPKSIRVNTLKVSEKELVNRLRKEGVVMEKIPFLDFGYWAKSEKFSLGSAPEHLMGYYYVQETAAQIPVQALAPKPDETVLDMSAAPGGKLTQIAQYMNNKGTIIALDNNNLRLMTLRNNIERIGVKNAIIYQKDAKFVSDLAMNFDRVLLDAPCSGNFAIDETWFEKRKVSELKNVSKVQKQMMNAAYSVLKKGGTLVYSTCSLEPEEDEFVVSWFLEQHDDMKLQKIDISIGDPGLNEAFGIKFNPEIKLCKRFWPNKTKTQGFFIAKFVKE